MDSSADNSLPMKTRTRLDTPAMAILLVLCASWGLQQVTIKVANTGIPPILQAGIRSVGAMFLLWAWMRIRKTPLFEKDGTLWLGIAAGAAFAAEFILLYWGMVYTNASRAVIFLYTMPFFTAVGVQLFIPAERLRVVQVIGLCCAFAGIVAAFGESLRPAAGRMWVGDAMALGGALMWAVVTVVVKASRLATISPAKVLFYQLAVSAVLLPICSLAFGEPFAASLTPVIIACLVYQALWVAFITYLVWFWLIRHYPVSRLSAFAFFTPLFGVLAGALLLGEPVTAHLLTALVLVGTGIYLVNRPPREPS